MATSRRDPQQNARVNRGIQNISPGLKPSESDQELRRARSVPTSPDRRLSPSPASISSNTCRPASSFNARTTSSRSTSSSASSSHGKTLHSASSMAGPRQTNTVRRKAEKPAATSVWPPALAVPNTSSKDTTRAAKSPYTMQKSNNLSTRLSVEKAAPSYVKLKSQKKMAGPLGAGKTQAASSSTGAPGATTKNRMGTENYVSIQRTTSVPARQKETLKIEEQDVELLMEFDETESISTSSIEEHLHERLPDPVELKPVDLNSKTSSSQEEYKNQEHTGDILEEKHDGKDNEVLRTGDWAYVRNSFINIPKAVVESELEEAVDETGLKKDVCVTEMNETVDQTKLNEAVSETESKEANDEAKLKHVDCETALKEAPSGTELRDAVTELEPIAQEKAKTEEKIMQPIKTVDLAQKWRKDEGRSNQATEEGRSKPIQERNSKVMALVGRFETAMSG